MTRFYFVRHCKVEYTEDDKTRPLSEQGREDAKKVTEMFRNIQVDRVISSPYDRAIDTVKGIALSRDINIECFEDLRERKVAHGFIEDFGSFIMNQWNDFTFKLDGGESLEETQDRGIKVLSELVETYDGENIVVGTHGTILSVIMNYFDEKYDFEFWKTIKMPDVYRFDFEGEKLIMIENEAF